MNCIGCTRKTDYVQYECIMGRHGMMNVLDIESYDILITFSHILFHTKLPLYYPICKKCKEMVKMYFYYNICSFDVITQTRMKEPYKLVSNPYKKYPNLDIVSIDIVPVNRLTNQNINLYVYPKGESQYYKSNDIVKFLDYFFNTIRRWNNLHRTIYKTKQNIKNTNKNISRYNISRLVSDYKDNIESMERTINDTIDRLDILEERVNRSINELKNDIDDLYNTLRDCVNVVNDIRVQVEAGMEEAKRSIVVTTSIVVAMSAIGLYTFL